MAALWYRCGCHWHGRLVEMLQTLRTLIVDDEPLAIERLQILAGQQDGIALVGTASDGASALRMVDALAPDLLLCDIAMPDLNGLEVDRKSTRLNSSHLCASR